MFKLLWDISCQQLGDECKLEGFCVPFGHREGKCICIEIYICIGYMLPTIWRACYRCMLILDKSCQKFGDNCKLGGFFVPFGHRVGECTFLENAYLYWIYAANILGSMWWMSGVVDVLFYS